MRALTAALCALFFLSCAFGGPGSPDPVNQEAPPPQKDDVRVAIDNQYWSGGVIYIFDADNRTKLVRIDLGGSGLYWADVPWHLVEDRQIGVAFKPTSEDLFVLGHTPGTGTFQRLTLSSPYEPWCVVLKNQKSASHMSVGEICRAVVEDATTRGKKTS